MVKAQKVCVFCRREYGTISVPELSPPVERIAGVCERCQARPRRATEKSRSKASTGLEPA
jgi:hypothetical protein